MVKLGVKLLTDDYKNTGIAPVWATDESACFDLFLAQSLAVPFAGDTVKSSLLVAFDIPKGYCVKLYPRSSTLLQWGLDIPVSIIDRDYTNAVHVIGHGVWPWREDLAQRIIGRGNRILQGMLIKLPKYKLKVVPSIRITDRGGLGSTGI
jgi:dUTPase